MSRLIDADKFLSQIEDQYMEHDITREKYMDLEDRIMQQPTIEERKTEWTPCSERLPELRDWYLGIFKEPDTGWINPIPFICDYLLGKKTKATTKEGWILKGFTDGEEYIDYYFNLECVAWMPLPSPHQTERREE